VSSYDTAQKKLIIRTLKVEFLKWHKTVFQLKMAMMFTTTKTFNTIQ